MTGNRLFKRVLFMCQELHMCFLLEPPSIELDSKLTSDMVQVRAGTTLKLDAAMYGKPEPNVPHSFFFQFFPKLIIFGENFRFIGTKVTVTLSPVIMPRSLHSLE